MSGRPPVAVLSVAVISVCIPLPTPHPPLDATVETGPKSFDCDEIRSASQEPLNKRKVSDVLGRPEISVSANDFPQFVFIRPIARVRVRMQTLDQILVARLDRYHVYAVIES